MERRVSAWTKALNNKELEDLAGMYQNSPDLTVMWLEGAKTVGFEEYETMIADFYGRARFMNFAAQSPRGRAELHGGGRHVQTLCGCAVV